MRTRGFLFVAILVGVPLLGCGEGSDELDYERTCPAGNDSLPCQVFDQVNRERAEVGRTPYEWSAELAEAAQAHCEDMVANGYFDHAGLDGSSFDQRAVAAGYTGAPTGENIAQGATTAAGVMSLWMASEGHRENILAAGSTEIGVGWCGDSTWVQVFGANR